MTKKKIIIRISGMDCANCAQSIEKALKKQKGVSSASVNFVRIYKVMLSYQQLLRTS